MYNNEKVSPKERFQAMEDYAQQLKRMKHVLDLAKRESLDHFKGQFWHPVKGLHCICGVVECPSPIFCNCNQSVTKLRREQDKHGP